MIIKINGHLPHSERREESVDSLKDGTATFSENIESLEVANKLEEHTVRDSNEGVKNRLKSRFRLIKGDHTSYKITPNAQVKNDKVDLFIDSFSHGYKEMYQQINKFKITDEGIFLPEQDKVFFETLIKKEYFSNYITTGVSNSEYVKQQIGFTWDCKISERSELNNELLEIAGTGVATGYEFRFKYTQGLSLKVDGRTEEKPLREFLDLSRTLMKDERVFVQFGFKPCERDWFKEAEKQIKELPKRKHISETSKLKLGYSGFDCCLRVVVVSPDVNRRIQIYRGYYMAIKQLNGDQELVSSEIKHKKFSKWFENMVLSRSIPTPLVSSRRMIMSWKEMANLVKLPRRSLQVDFNLQSVERVEPNIPKVLQTAGGIEIGHTEFRGKKHLITIPVDNDDTLFNTTVFFGSPRVGKDTAQCNYILEVVNKANCGAVVPDVINEPERGMADTLRSSLPSSKIVDIDMTDLESAIYFGLDDLVSEIGVDLVSNDLVKILELEDKFDSKQLCRIVAKANNCNLYEMFLFLSNDDYAKSVVERLKEKDELLSLELEHKYFNKKGTSDGSAQAKRAVLTRLDDFLSLEQVKYMFAQKPNRKFDLKELLLQNKVIILRMTKTGGLGEMACRMLMYLLTVKVFWLKKNILKENKKCRTFIVYNEFHQFLSKGFEETLTDMLFEAPKYKLGMLLCLHSPEKISRSLWSMIQSASVNMFLFKNTNFQVYRDLSEQLDPIDINMAAKTERFESIFLPYIGKQLTPFFCRMLPPPVDRVEQYDNERITKEHLLKHGESKKVIREYIRDKEISMYTSDPHC